MSYPNIRPPVAAITHERMTIGVIFASKSLALVVVKPPPVIVI